MYSRVLDGRTLTFGHEGILYRNSFIMYDKQTGSLWVHTTGQAIKGRLKGSQLEFIPSLVTTWGRWKKDHPDTTVLPGRRARGFMGTFSLAKNIGRYGLSMGQGKTVKLYLFTTLERQRVINDEFNGKNIVVVFDATSMTAAAFERDERTFQWKDGSMKDSTGAAWDLLGGTSGDATLPPIPATPWLVDRWRVFYPRKPVYRGR